MTKRVEHRENLWRLRGMAAKTSDPRAFREVAALIDRIFNPRTPCFELSIRTTASIAGNPKLTEFMARAGLAEKYKDLGDGLMCVLLDRGFRDWDFHTPQEHRLTGSGYPARYDASPHIPICVQEGQSIRETDIARRLAVRFAAQAPYFGGPEASRFIASFEPLDSEGRTIRDPRRLSQDKAALATSLLHLPYETVLDAAAVPFSRSDRFPFRRD